MTLDDLAALIARRADAAPDSSWTAKLLAMGPEKCAEKFGEEAIEAIIEAVKNDKPRLTSEAADVLFHLLVMLHSRSVPLSDVMAELARRQGTSGLDEKSQRALTTKNSPTTIAQQTSGHSEEKKVCPECGHVFRGRGWDGIDAHWRSKHEDIMRYEDAWPLLRDGRY